VKKDDILGRDHKSANAFEAGKKKKRGKPITRRKAIA
jgi:dolichyl-diphosphooligosaccharide---protein glycosyltransferase